LGHFDGQIDLDSGVGTNTVTSSGCGDIYLVKLNAAGQHLWGFKIGGSSCDYPYAIAVDPSDNFYITGYYSSSNVDFNPGPATNSVSSFNSNYDIFIAKYDVNGSYVFAQSFGDAGNDEGIDVYATSTGCILVGYFEGTVDMNGSVSTNAVVSAGGQDGFVAAYLGNGQFVNAFRFGGAQNDAAYGVRKRNASEFAITGTFQRSNIDFDPGVTQAVLSSAGGADAFFAIYNQNVLPVKIIDFTARKDGKGNILQWVTSQEESLAYYGVQRSANGKDFSDIANVAIHGGTTATGYSYIDENPFKASNYYRLKLVDIDGKTEFSAIRKVDNHNGLVAAINPNPTKNQLNIKLDSDMRVGLTIQIIGPMGKSTSLKK
jgi:hypothetical protein